MNDEMESKRFKAFLSLPIYQNMNDEITKKRWKMFYILFPLSIIIPLILFFILYYVVKLDILYSSLISVGLLILFIILSFLIPMLTRKDPYEKMTIKKAYEIMEENYNKDNSDMSSYKRASLDYFYALYGNKEELIKKTYMDINNMRYELEKQKNYLHNFIKVNPELGYEYINERKNEVGKSLKKLKDLKNADVKDLNKTEFLEIKNQIKDTIKNFEEQNRQDSVMRNLQRKDVISF